MQTDDAAERYRNRHATGDEDGVDPSQLAASSQEAYVRERPGPSCRRSRGALQPVELSRAMRSGISSSIRFRPAQTRRGSNPLDGVRVGTPYEVRDAERLAEALLGTHRQTSHTLTESHFAEHGARALAALMLHVLYKPDTERTLAAVLRTVTDPTYYDISTLVDAVCRATHDHDATMGWPRLAWTSDAHVSRDRAAFTRGEHRARK